MEKTIKLSDNQLERLMETYQEERQELAGQIDELKSKLKDIDGLIASFKEARGQQGDATEEEPKSKRGRGKGVAKAAKATRGKGKTRKARNSKGPSFAERILTTLKGSSDAMTASQLADVLIQDEPDADDLNTTKYKQNIHSNLNSLMKRGAITRVEGSSPFAYAPTATEEA